MNGIHNSLNIVICQNAGEAIERGFVYRTPEYAPIRIEKAVVVREGTEEGNGSIDLIMVDEKGQKYVALLTAALLDMAVKAAT